MRKVLSAVCLLYVFLIPAAVSADTIVPCPDCTPAVADTWPHTGKYGAGTRYFYLHNYWHHDLTVHANGNGNGCTPAWTNLTFTLKKGKDTILHIPPKWASARIWGLWDPAYSNGPFTLFEMTLHAGWGCDWYNVSLVDGYNLPGLFKPIPGTFVAGNPNNLPTEGRPPAYTCGQGGCTTDLYLTAPVSMLKLSATGDTNGFYCADNAACRTLKKTACPTSYSWAFDDPTSLFTCPSAHINDAASAIGPDYVIYFGLPPATSVNDNNKTMNYTCIGNASITITRSGELKYLYGGGEPAWLEIYSCSGKLMLRTPIRESGSLTVPKLNRGVYIVSLKSDHVLATKQMMVSR